MVKKIKKYLENRKWVTVESYTVILTEYLLINEHYKKGINTNIKAQAV